jgi:phage shock protein A
METLIEATTGAAARAIASERLLGQDLADHEQKARSWHARAEEAVVQGDDDLARQAIARAHEHEALARALVEQQSAARQTARALRDQVLAMRAKRSEARRKLASLSGRRQVVEAGRALRGMARAPSGTADGFARFERLRPQIERAEAEADALGELYESVDRDEVETASREQARRIEAALQAIKERLRRSGPPPG